MGTTPARQALTPDDSLLGPAALYAFYRQETGSPVNIPRHHVYLSDVMREAVVSPAQEFVGCEVPVRHGKTTILSIAGLAWTLLIDPDASLFVTSSSDDLCSMISSEIMSIIATVGRYHGLTVSTKKRSVESWRVAMKGRDRGTLLAKPTGSKFQGFGFKVITIDDPIGSRKDAESEVIRGSVNDWYDGTLRDRLDPNGACIIAMARWHERDLMGHVREKADIGGDRYRIISMPAIADPTPNEPDPLGRAPGEPLWPAVRPLEELQRMRNNSPVDFASKYQGRPNPKTGSKFKVENWRRAPFPTGVDLKGLQCVRGWDLATKKESGADWSVGVLVALHDGLIWVLDVSREQINTAEMPAHLKAYAMLDGRHVKVAFEKGKADAGAYQQEFIDTALVGHVTDWRTKLGNKTAKASIVEAWQAASKVVFTDEAVNRMGADAYEALIDRFTKWPNARWDDEVDALAIAIDSIGVDAEAEFVGPETLAMLQAPSVWGGPGSSFAGSFDFDEFF